MCKVLNAKAHITANLPISACKKQMKIYVELSLPFFQISTRKDVISKLRVLITKNNFIIYTVTVIPLLISILQISFILCLLGKICADYPSRHINILLALNRIDFSKQSIVNS